MVDGIKGTSNIASILGMYAYSDNKPQPKTAETSSSITNFDLEDKAIISSQAKMLNELDKYNSGAGNELDLALSQIHAKTQVEASVNVINTKKEMIDTVLEIGKNKE